MKIIEWLSVVNVQAVKIFFLFLATFVTLQSAYWSRSVRLYTRNSSWSAERILMKFDIGAFYKNLRAYYNSG
jgi:radical SAM superfamily enzyme